MFINLKKFFHIQGDMVLGYVRHSTLITNMDSLGVTGNACTHSQWCDVDKLFSYRGWSEYEAEILSTVIYSIVKV